MWMKSLLIVCGLLIMPRPNIVPVRWLISASSSLRVNGSTNVNTFACEISHYGRTDTLSTAKATTGDGLQLNGQMHLQVNLFDCHNTIMTRDLRKTLNEDRYPQLLINFISLTKKPTPGIKQQPISGVVDIELAGVIKQFELLYEVSPASNNSFCLTGTRDVNFSDFNLKAPRKLGGMIRTNDKLTIEFRLMLKPI